MVQPATFHLARHQQCRIVHSPCLATTDHPAGFGLVEGDYAVTIDQTTGDFNSAWSGYMNIWVRDIGPLGYSPLGGSGNGDGVTCHPQAFSSISCGGNSLYGAYDLGRTITHEVGHYLLLNHPWGQWRLFQQRQCRRHARDERTDFWLSIRTVHRELHRSRAVAIVHGLLR